MSTSPKSVSSASSTTISNIIQQIETTISKSKYDNMEPSQGQVRYHKRWTPAEKEVLQKLVKEYGSDFTYFKKFLPFKTRRQIQRGYEIQANKQLCHHRAMQNKDRKIRFDMEVLGDDSHHGTDTR